jgi:hypothetical protein
MMPWTVVAAAVNSERLTENANTSDDVAAGFGIDFTGTP